MDDDPPAESQGTNKGVGVNMPPVEKVMPVIFYAAMVIWVVSVVVNVWSALTTSGSFSPQSAEFSMRLQFAVSALAAPWGYLLIAVIAFSVTAFLRERT